MSYPPNPNNPYGGQPGYGYPQQPGVPPQGPGAGQQQPGMPPQAPGAGQQQPGMPPQAPGMPPQGYGYPQQPGVPPQQPGMPPQGYGHPQQYLQQPGYPGGMYPPPMRPPYASWGARVGAMLLDGLLMMAAQIVLTVIALAAFLTDPSYDAATGTYEPGGLDTAGLLLILLGSAITLGLGLWMIHKEGTTGQTPGKKALNIAVLREADGRTLGFGNAFLRRLCHILDNMACYIGWLWPLWDDKRQTFADKIMNTVVVKTH